MPRVYLDTCCLNRPFDDQAQDRIRLEAEAVRLIMRHIEQGDWEWVGSDVLAAEIERTRDPERRERLQAMLGHTFVWVRVDEPAARRGEQLVARGFGAFDALHAACAERGHADVLLTTDDHFLRRAEQHQHALHIIVANPVAWLEKGT